MTIPMPTCMKAYKSPSYVLINHVLDLRLLVFRTRVTTLLANLFTSNICESHSLMELVVIVKRLESSVKR